MYQLRRQGPVAYEDLLRELEAVEHQLLSQDSALAMDLMVLEAKIRDRFRLLECQTLGGAAEQDDDLTMEDIRALIPRDFPEFPTMASTETRKPILPRWRTVGMAAALAVATALGVFGFASLLQFTITSIL